MADGSSSMDISVEDRKAEASDVSEVASAPADVNREASEAAKKKEKNRKKKIKRKKKKEALNHTDPSTIHGADYEARSITCRFTDECLLQRIEKLFLCFQKDSDRIVKLMDAMFEDGTQPFNEGNVRFLSSIWPAISRCITELEEFVMRFKSSCRDETVSTAFPSEESRQRRHRSVLAGESSLSKTHDHSLKLIRKYIESMEEEYKHVEDYLSTLGPFGLIEEYDYLSFNRVYCYRRCLLFCLGMFHELREALDPYYHPLLSLESASVNAISSFKSRMNEKIIESNDKGRFVCVTDGFVIYCLDLRQSKDESKKYVSGFNVLPKISTINLLESGLPVSMGLFKLGGNAYMVGGQEFPGLEDHPELKFPHGLYWKYGFEGTSRKIHRLCFGHCGLRLSQCNTSLPLLREPKFWPIVEIIGDHIYVMDSVPDAHGFEAPKSIPFIEVLNLNDPGRGWIKLPPIYDGTFSYPFYIKNHLVIGDRIHADSHCGLRFVLDCEKNEWKLHGSVDKRFHVTELIGFENAKCIGQLKTGSEDDHIYVVLAIGNQFSRKVPKYEDYLVVKAEAHLVSLNGYVIYTLELSHFFKGFLEGGEKRWMVLRSSYSSVEEEENSMCVVALMRDIETKLDHLYISTFTYQFLPSWDRAQFQDGDEGFVTVVVKERHMYQVGLDLRGGGDLYHPAPRISACFL